MLKKLLTAAAFLLFGTSFVMAEESGETFDIFGSASAGYKMQNDFKTPFDKAGLPMEGAANRSKQNVTQSFELSLLALADADGSEKYPEWMVWAQIKGSPLSPDKEDGASPVEVGEAFVIWKPHIAFKIKIGKHSLIKTYYDGHGFSGPSEFDAICTASSAGDGAGLTLGAFLGSANHEAGISMMNEGPIVSVLYAASEADNEPEEGGHKNAVIWYEGKMFDKALQVRFAHQTVEILNSHADDDIRADSDSPNHNQYGEYSTHTVTGLNMWFKLGPVKTDFGYWEAAGKAPWNSPFDDYTELEIKATGMVLGVEINDLGPGQLALEYSTVSTPEYGEEGCARSILDLKNIMSLEYVYKVRENAKIKLTHRQLTAGDYWSETDFSDPIDAQRASLYDWSSTSMTAITFSYDFGDKPSF